MQTYDALNVAAIAERHTVPREFLSITARDPSDDSDVRTSMWSDAGQRDFSVYSVLTGAVEVRTFEGAGQLVAIDAIPRVANLTVQSVGIRLSGVLQTTADLIHGYNLRRAKVELWRGWLNPSSRELIGPAEPRFLGFIDEIEWPTPAVADGGDTTEVVLKCQSIGQQLTFRNPEKRSNESQRIRAASDAFLADAVAVGEWELFWGTARGTVETEEPEPKLSDLYE